MSKDIDVIKEKTIEATIKSLSKKLGDGIIFSLDNIPEIKYFPTRLFTLNRALNLGGMPIGRVVEIVKNEGCGKTTLALTLAADAQASGMTVAYLDLEMKVDAEYAKRLGVQTSNFVFSRPANGDDAMFIIDKLADQEGIGLIILDSVDLLTTYAELDKEIYESNVGMKARLMSQALRRLIPKVARNQISLVFINQYRQVVGQMFGNPNKSTGGRGLQYGSSLKIELRDGKMIKDGDKPVGKKVHIKVTKNQVGSPYGETELDLYFGDGFDRYSDLFDAAMKEGILDGGAWVKYKGENIANGRDKCIELFKNNQEIYEKVLGDLKCTL